MKRIFDSFNSSHKDSIFEKTVVRRLEEIKAIYCLLIQVMNKLMEMTH